MYLNLYKGLKLKPKDLVSYDSLLVGFNRKIVVPRGQIRDQTTCSGRVRSRRGRFYHGGRIFPLYYYHGKTLASCPGGYFFNLALESEVSLKGPDRGAHWKSGYG